MKRPAILGILIGPLALVPVLFWTNPGILSSPSFGIGVLAAFIYYTARTYVVGFLVLVLVVFVLRLVRVVTFSSIVIACAVVGYCVPYVEILLFRGWEGMLGTIHRHALDLSWGVWGFYGAVLGIAFCLIVGVPIRNVTPANEEPKSG